MSKNEVSNITNNVGKILKEPGDIAEMYVTETGIKVGKVKTKEINYSRTEYKNGTVVETKSSKTNR